MYRLVLPIVFATSVLGAGTISLPKNLRVCARNNPDLNSCLKSSIQSALVDLAKGSRPLGVLPIDPLELTSLSIDQGSGPVTVNLDFKNLHIHGIKKSIIESVEVELNKDVKELKITARTDGILALVGNYTVRGQVLILPVFGSGNCRIELSGTKTTLKFTGKTVTKDGHVHLIINNVELDLDPQLLKFHFENLFNGDKALGDNMNLFLNENWKEVYGELKSPINRAFGLTFSGIVNQIFSKVPFNEIFPQ